jgi:5-methylcytosine-specific restriction protein B
MNSTDRSIALVDFALRRRFAFKQIGTDLDILRRWYEKNPPKIQPERIIELLRKLNEKIVQDERLGESFEIGHSYFMKPEIDKERLGRIWDLHILPLIQEYYPAQPQDVEGFKELFTDMTKDFNPS